MKIQHLAIIALLCGAQFPTPNALAQAPAPLGIKALRDLVYVDGGAEHQKLDLDLPEKASAPLPLIIWIHGGGFSAGDKTDNPARRMLDQGYAVASLNYRLSGEALFPAQIEDCKAAVRWLRVHAKAYNLDPERFGAWGSSAGGHLVALLGTSGGVKEFEQGAHLELSSRVQAVCDYYGPTDFLQMDAHAVPDARLKHDPSTSPESRLIGGAIQENKDKVARANPITFVTPDDPPFLIVHGDQDPLVPYHQSQLLFEALKKAAVSAHLHTIHGAGHGQGFAGKNIDDSVDEFFKKNLKENTSARSTPEALATESVASAMGPDRAQLPGANPGVRRRIPWEAVLARDDKNKDGKISSEEFSGPPALFKILDHNHDGFVTREEYEAFEARERGQQPAAATPTPNAAAR